MATLSASTSLALRLVSALALASALAADHAGGEEADASASASASASACASGNGYGSTSEPRRDHALLQLTLARQVDFGQARAQSAAEAESEAEAEVVSTGASVANVTGGQQQQRQPQPLACTPSSVTRRRRAASMCSCRRRSGWRELPAGMRCDAATNVIVNDGSSPPTAAPGESLEWGADSQGKKAAGLWCEVAMPPVDWSLKSCPVQGGSTSLKVLSYNLFWWNLFGRRGGNGQSAGRKIAQTSGPEQYDLMGFQECDDMHRILGDARNQGLSGEYSLLNGGRALAVAWRTSRFTLLADGSTDVGEDHSSQYYGKRAAQWVRLLHRDGSTVFFLNHHGPLPVSHSGGCTGSSTAYNILKVIARNAQANDVIVVVGDFNAQPHSSRIQALDGYLHRVFTGSSMGGVDHILSNCAASNTANLGSGGSDHDALSAVFRI